MNTLFINVGEQAFIIFFLLLALAPLAFAIVALVDLSKREFGGKTTDKVLWIGLIVFVPLVGSLVYYISFRNGYPLKNE